MSEFLQLDIKTQDAFKALDRVHQKTGRWPKTKEEVRRHAEKWGANVTDLLAVVGFPSPRASRIAKSLSRIWKVTGK